MATSKSLEIAPIKSQQVQYLDLDNLRLWTENPRDPIDTGLSNEEVVLRALDDPNDRWNLPAFAKEMGGDFDHSELPTVVRIPETDNYRVYDGNRRVVLAWLASHGFPEGHEPFALPKFPYALPCNVCDSETALDHVDRKHRGHGGWRPYERDLFAVKYRNKKRSVLVRLETRYNAISKWPSLNQRWVRDDLLTAKNLRSIGLVFDKVDFGVPDDVMVSLLRDIVESIDDGRVSTRKARNDLSAIVSTATTKRIKATTTGALDSDSNEDGASEESPAGTDSHRSTGPDGVSAEGGSGGSANPASESEKAQHKGWRRNGSKEMTRPPLFNHEQGLDLEAGDVNTLYLTLERLYKEFTKNPSYFGDGFPPVFRMGLRLLVETAGDETEGSLDKYVKKYAGPAKKQLTSDTKTFLNEYSVSPDNLTGLLHTGAHNYPIGGDASKALAMSLLIGEMLLLSHGRGHIVSRLDSPRG